MADRDKEFDFWEIFNAVPEMVIIQDAETGDILEVNAETLVRVGLPRQEIIHKGVACFSPDSEEYSPERAARYVMKAAQGEPQTFEWGYVNSAGDLHPTEVSLKLVPISGRPCLLATAREISDRKRAEEDLINKTLELERSNAALQQFAYVASHDMQEPLRMVQAFGDLLRRRCSEALDEAGERYLGFMLGAAARMSALIQGLLDYSRVTTGGRAFEPTDLSLVAREAARGLRLRFKEASGRVDIGELPTIDADPLQMRQLLENLLGNALKFRRPDEPPVVKVSALEVDGFAHLKVEDNGIGLDEKYASQIFEVFQRLHTSEEYQGTGIGLAICQMIVERHGGNITVTSAPGCGATFTVALPRAQVSGGDAP